MKLTEAATAGLLLFGAYKGVRKVLFMDYRTVPCVRCDASVYTDERRPLCLGCEVEVGSDKWQKV